MALRKIWRKQEIRRSPAPRRGLSMSRALLMPEIDLQVEKRVRHSRLWAR